MKLQSLCFGAVRLLALITFFCVVSLSAYGGETRITAKQFFKLSPENRVEYLISKQYYSDSREAYNGEFLDSLANSSEVGQDDKLKLYIDLFRLSKLQYRNPDAKSNLLAFEKEHSLLGECRYPDIRGLYFLYYGQYYVRIGQREMGFKLYLLSVKELESIGFENLPFGGDYLHGLSVIYYTAGYYDQAIKYLKRASYCPFVQPFARINALHALGFCYKSDNIRDYRMAARYFAKSYNLARQLKDDIMCFSSMGDYARALQLQGRNKEALFFLDKILRDVKPVETFNRSVFYLYKAEILLTENRLVLAKACIQKSDSLIETETFLRKRRRLPDYYRVMSLLYRKTGKYDKVLAYGDSIIELKDSTNIVASNRILEEFETGVNAEKYFSALAAIESARKREIQIGIFFSVCFLLTGAVIVFGFQQRKRELRKEEELDRKMKGVVEQKAARVIEMRDQQLMQIQEKNVFIDKINSELFKLRRLSERWSENKENDHEDIDALLASVIVTDADWEAFKLLFEKIHPGFLEKVSRNYKFLTSSEIRLVVLNKLGIRNKEMAVILGVTKNSIHKYTYRLRLKLERHGLDIADLLI